MSERNERVNRRLLTVVVVGLTSTVLYLQVRPTLTAPPTHAGGLVEGLDLTADRDLNNLRIRWNRNASTVKSARSGALVLRGSGRQTTVELSDAGLKLGETSYARPSEEVTIRLMLRMPDGSTATESLVSIAEPP